MCLRSMIISFVLASLAWADTTVYEVTSPYHHIKVVDYTDYRVLHFDASFQSRVSLTDPNQGHFEYTQYFHMPWLWNPDIKSILMIGLGGGSTQRALLHAYPKVKIDTVELDPKVVDVAKRYFHFQENKRSKVYIGDGRMHLRRTIKTYDLIILDAYTANRYGSFIPYPLVTKEFFALVKKRLSAKGILAYNVIGDVDTRQKCIVGSLYRTMKTSFPQVYTFSALSSYNVVFVATLDDESYLSSQLQERTEAFPDLKESLKTLNTYPPRSIKKSPILTDDFAPVDGLLRTDD